jgi:hypothetical protein
MCLLFFKIVIKCSISSQTGWGRGYGVLNVTVNNILVISWRSVLLVEETGVPAEKTTDMSQVTDKLYQIIPNPSPYKEHGTLIDRVSITCHHETCWAAL